MTDATHHTLLGRLPTLAAAALAAMMALATPAMAQVNRIAAVVNGDVITLKRGREPATPCSRCPPA
jgi:hypothetical protein